MRSRRDVRLLAVLLGVGLLLGVTGGATYAAFFATTSNAGNSFTAGPDTTPPTATSVIGRVTSYLTGSIRQGGNYYVYANVTDTGNPASGVATVRADVSQISTGQTSVSLFTGPCPCTVGGVTYVYRSNAVVANNPLAAGSRSYTLTLTDNAGNSQTQTGFSVMVDNTSPTGVDIQTANGGATVGHAENGDTITYTFSEPIDPQSILGGWTGAATTVQVRFGDAVCGANDRVRIRDTSGNVLPLGDDCLGRSDYVTTTRTFTTSTMVQSGNTITVTLNNASVLATGTAAGPGTMTWTPNASALDAAGNACSTAVATESGAADPEF